MVLYVSSGERGTSVHGADNSRQFLWKLLAVYAPENVRLFLVWPAIAQHVKIHFLQPHWRKFRICVLRALLKLFLKHYFS